MNFRDKVPLVLAEAGDVSIYMGHDRWVSRG